MVFALENPNLSPFNFGSQVDTFLIAPRTCRIQISGYNTLCYSLSVPVNRKCYARP